MERNQNPYNPTKNTLHFRYRILFTHRKDGERQKEHLVYLKCKCANNDDKHGAAFVAEDVGSSGGTLLNGMPLRSPTILRPGDTLSIGDTILRLEIASGTATVLAPPREQAPSVPQTPTTPAHLQPPASAYALPAALQPAST